MFFKIPFAIMKFIWVAFHLTTKMTEHTDQDTDIEFQVEFESSIQSLIKQLSSKFHSRFHSLQEKHRAELDVMEKKIIVLEKERHETNRYFGNKIHDMNLELKNKTENLRAATHKCLKYELFIASLGKGKNMTNFSKAEDLYIYFFTFKFSFKINQVYYSIYFYSLFDFSAHYLFFTNDFQRLPISKLISLTTNQRKHKRKQISRIFLRICNKTNVFREITTMLTKQLLHRWNTYFQMRLSSMIQMINLNLKSVDQRIINQKNQWTILHRMIRRQKLPSHLQILFFRQSNKRRTNRQQLVRNPEKSWSRMQLRIKTRMQLRIKIFPKRF